MRRVVAHPSSRAKALLPMLLVGALLLCHGVLGFAHQTTCHGGCEATDAVAVSSYAHGEHGPGDAGGDVSSGGAQDSGQAPAGYFAVALALFGAAFVGWLIGATGRRETAVLRPYRPRALPALACLPRGPTLPVLQVFRL
ncbi:hypothetical protein GBA65_21280 (plasmid) [Rubrobacter marinus]|uniref:Uncharacterized protein n=1 Tax=Rubrobacter marinus TaxID=2653852 RepID=A0A6G8Q3D4_9ACTN|nr:hypothetical protein [Rubrobacter marinus]QIN80991.1 hypothetical protein GBA65_21280 [Rubrobacter marinus]